MSDADPFEIALPPLSPNNLIRLGEDFLRATSVPAPSIDFLDGPFEPKYLPSVSRLMLNNRTLPAGLSSVEAAELAEVFRKAVSELSPLRWEYPRLHPWLRLHAHALLRESRIFSGLELYDEPQGCSYNGFADIWKGDYCGEPVCVKVIRTRHRTPLVRIEKVYRRISELDPHSNVLPVIEVSESLFPLCIVSPWMPDGNIAQYTQRNPGSDRLILLAQACRGLMHLHGLGILHGNITPDNILITRDGKACLGDFGITGAFRGLSFTSYELGTLRYMAPECLSFTRPLDRETSGHSTESDVHSLAVTSFSVLTGVLPYDDGDYDDIFWGIKNGVRPSRPQNKWLQDSVWNVIAAGWRREPKERCALRTVYGVFVENAKTDIETGQRRRGKLLPRIASFLQSLRDPEPEIEKYVNEIDGRLEDHTIPDRERLKLFNKLCKTCSRHRVIPKSMHIPDCSEGSVEVECGGFANVSQSVYQGRQVAIKAVRVYTTSDLDVILSRFCREGVAWKHLRHPNILPLLGVTVSEHRFALVSEWMENGNVNDFIKRDQHVNRVELLVDIANGLKYMHELRVVHGDLKGANILINSDRRACIADFGLSTITGVTTHAAAGASQASLISNDTLMSFTSGGTRRWMSPELLHPERFEMPESEDNRPTRQSDCYALGMVIYEVLCGHHPYVEFQSDILAVNAILEGIRPKKPEEAKRLGFSEELWKTVELCWLEDRNARPNVADILSRLNDATPFWYMRDF